MAEQKPKSKSQPELTKEGITHITVGGFKSIAQEQSIEIRPLTILAGANSSGKSSIMQPLLLLKQTLEATYDPGALLLNGPNARFTSVDQLLSRTIDRSIAKGFYIGFEVGTDVSLTTHFLRSKKQGFDVERTSYNLNGKKYNFYIDMSPSELRSIFTRMGTGFDLAEQNVNLFLTQERCFLTLGMKLGSGLILAPLTPIGGILDKYILQLIHLPGLRGNPERTYPVTAVNAEFPGTFENYVASVIGHWQTDRKSDKLEKMNYDLFRLGLTGKVVAKPIDDTQVELRVNRLLQGVASDFEDMVSIADVGLGVSQTLPVVVALHAADQGQLIYLEQPEIHLHPRALSAMAEVLADAVVQGKRLVVETHSSLLLLGIQTLVAEGKLPPEMVKLHWFKLQEDGSTQIISADLDETGAFGDWPEDFATVTLDSEDRYLEAASARLREQ